MFTLLYGAFGARLPDTKLFGSGVGDLCDDVSDGHQLRHFFQPFRSIVARGLWHKVSWRRAVRDHGFHGLYVSCRSWRYGSADRLGNAISKSVAIYWPLLFVLRDVNVVCLPAIARAVGSG